MRVHLDFETRSRTDLVTHGVYRYATDSSTDILCACYAIGERPVELWKLGQPIPEDLKDAALSESVNFVAHNATFERLIWHYVAHKRYGWPEIAADRWRCTAAMAAAMSLPRSLEQAAKALRLPIEKDLAGKKVMLKLCRPKNT